jgi:hypothetical protein
LKERPETAKKKDSKYKKKYFNNCVKKLWQHYPEKELENN